MDDDPLFYDLSAWEALGALRSWAGPWSREDLRGELGRRLEQEKRLDHLEVNYYRIGLRLRFELPPSQRVEEFPIAWEGFDGYPWQTWLAWRLEERWRVLEAAWRLLADAQAGEILQAELASLAGWSAFTEPVHGVNLVTGHFAGCLAMGLADMRRWNDRARRDALRAAEALLERDIRPWIAARWADDGPWDAGRLHNIGLIALARAAQLARVIGHDDAAELDRLTARAAELWLELRGKTKHTEGFAYDGYLLDHLTQWLAGRPDAAEWMKRPQWESVRQEWVQCLLPGRMDLQMPIGDVEGEMPFWTGALLRLARARDWPDAMWVLRRVAPSRLPASALADALELDGAVPEERPTSGVTEIPGAVALRTGWDGEGVLATIGCPSSDNGHLHRDAGHITIARDGRCWIVDPGYQQYRPGAERDYSIGPAAHNGPIIGGKTPTRQAARVEAAESRPDGSLYARVNLTDCYEGLPAGSVVRREIHLTTAGDVTVEDEFIGIKPGTTVEYHWHGGAQLAWSFADGRAMLSDDRRSLSIGTSAGAIRAIQLTRHPGTRGPWTLTDRRAIASRNWRCRWDFAWGA